MARPTSPKTVVSRLFDRSRLPIYLVDDSLRIIYGNPACAEWLGIDLDTLIGLKCQYCAEGDDATQTLSGGLCPPPQVFAGERMIAPIAAGIPSNRTRRHGEFIPLEGDAGDAVGVLVILDRGDSSVTQQAQGAFEATALHAQIQRIRQEVRQQYRLDRLIGQSPAIKKVRAQVRVAVESFSRALIFGAAGTGRETVARTIHHGRGRGTAAPLIPLSCSLLDAQLLQTTVEAFVRRCAELTEEEPGTLLLLEVDQLARDAQGALMGFLEISELELKTVATASRRLVDLAAEDAFRGDLAHALSTIEIDLPTLTSRVEDIPLLAQYFAEEWNRRGGKQLGGFTPEAVDELVMYHWPGNIDELAEFVSQACSSAAGPLIDVADLPEKLKLAADAAAHPHVEDETIVLDDFLAQIETELIRRALDKAKGNKTKAAQLLGVNRPRLLRRISQLNID